MKRIWTIILGLLVWVAIIAYLVASSRLSNSQQSGQMVKSIEVVVRDSAQIQIITPAMVRLWLAREGFKFLNTPVAKINTAQIEKLVTSRGFVRSAQVHTTMDGVIHISLTQRKPIARVNTTNGYNFYITDDNYILPLQNHSVLYVPVITGNFTPPFERNFVGSLEANAGEMKKKYAKSYDFTVNLINFVRLVQGDNFWAAQVVQINVLGGGSGKAGERWQEPDVEVIPRAGSHVIMMGDVRNPQKKFEKMMTFYKKVLSTQRWDHPQMINLKFENQIVCSDLK